MPPRHASGRRRDSDSGGSECSDGSRNSASTAPTIFSVWPGRQHWETEGSPYWTEYTVPTEEEADEQSSLASDEDDAASVLTYASTAPSVTDVDDEEDPGYDVYDPAFSDGYAGYEPTAIPSTPAEFAEFFPSSRRLCIRHDDTLDGNMNLRLDTQVPATDGRRLDLTLFHLRMHDLKNRECSLRRYCRSSGREVCHSTRKYAKPAADRRPALSRSMGSALASFRPKSSESKVRAHTAALKRTDSGYDSLSDDDDDDDASKAIVPASLRPPTNTINIEFANYAHVELKRRGAKASKRYEFAYWGRSYSWRRTINKNHGLHEISYHLYDAQEATALAHIVPVPMTPHEAEEEEAKGGWIPPSSMWISDPQRFGKRGDVADVVVATGLMALVDDSIKQRWHRKDRFTFPVPLPSLTSKGLNMDYIGPKRLIDEVFNRRAPASGPRFRRQTSA